MSYYTWTKEHINNYDTFLFDCDGVLWHENDLIPGAVATIQHLIECKKRILFITNNSGKSRQEYAEKIQGMGFPIHLATENIEELVICSSYATAQYLKRLSQQHTNKNENANESDSASAAECTKPTFDYTKDKVLIIGDSGIGRELGYANIQFVETRQLFPDHLPRSQLAQLPLDPTIRAICVGIEDQLTYTKVAYAVAHLRSDPSILFISTNDDANLPTTGHILPGLNSHTHMHAFPFFHQHIYYHM
jgi:4-nitrophenyl phosphatase